MKQLYFLFFLFFVLNINTDAQAPRRVLVEEFTQASCPPCAVYNPGFHKIIFTPGNETKVSLLCYQTSWPGSDPMNAQNPTDVANRVTYYAVNAVPDCFADGGATKTGTPIFHGNIADFTQSIIDNRAAVTSPVEVTVDHILRDKLDSVSISVTVKNVSANALLDENTLQIALIEKEVDFKIAPGTNGEMEFFSVTRKLVPNSGGTKVGALDPGASKTFNYTIVIPTYIYNLRNIGVITFVQHTTKKEILQSAESYPKPLPTASKYVDLRATGTVNGYTGLCDGNVSMKVDLFNDGTDTIKTISIDLIVNSVKQTGQTALAVNLPAGGVGSYEFKNINIKAGKSSLNYRINNVNGASKDIDKLNHTNVVTVLYNVEATPFATAINEEFAVSARGVFPAHTYSENNSSMRVYPADKAFFGVTEEVGGFGNSPFSLFWDFYFGPENTEVNFFFDKVDLTNSKNTFFAISRAYAQKGTELASLIIEASKDCGANWTTFYAKEGADLATADPSPGAFFAPNSAQWIRDTVSIAEFDGAAEVIFRLKGYNPFGGSNLMFLDDINVGSLIVGTDEPGILNKISIYPNPTHDKLTLDISTTEAAIATVQLFDVNGKMVSVLDHNASLIQGKNVKTYNVSGFHSGIYNLKVVTPKGVRNSFVTIH
ncbi:MAG: T9SS type A sorting domain-containing protein [Saprospiraceae bacterium]|nr:T9SS type A sorting domain-containing protein [Saprospiraceae bacterium]MBK9223086.1 T9SS type A sorting domain-containing protein [Saprospiraceae bacterium]MBK9727605.1 T9SS type A sorting domain-containing protein [Saprospiraceae bacterium]